ncbi:MAG: hypothetical protein DRP01_07010 [Archaeoglobales archaeon]|nr:MAG: hypothetical protein DRP01_07010 [Archaeoglobales archaeon]
MRYVFLDKFDPSYFKYSFFKLLITKMKHDILRELVFGSKNVECYINNKQLVDVLNNELGLELKPSDRLYRYREGDVLFIVSLKYPRLDDITLDDLDVWMIEVARK